MHTGRPSLVVTEFALSGVRRWRRPVRAAREVGVFRVPLAVSLSNSGDAEVSSCGGLVPGLRGCGGVSVGRPGLRSWVGGCSSPPLGRSDR